MEEFRHLHLHTADGSFLDGATSIDDVAETCNRLGMNSVAVTEHGNLHSMLSFEKTMKKAGITPLSGQEFYLTLDPLGAEKKTRDNFHLTILAMNPTGYKNLRYLSSLAALMHTHYVPRITLDWLRKYNEGIFVLSGCIASYINQAIIAATWDKPDMDRLSGDRQREATGIALGDIEAARNVFKMFVEMFPNRFAVEIMYHDFILEKHVMTYLLSWAEEFNIPIVATNDVHYAAEKDASVQNTLLAIMTGGGVNGKNSGLEGVPGAWIKNADEMVETFKGTPLNTHNPHHAKYLSNSLMIAEMCTFERPEVHSLLPKFPVPEGHTIESFLQYQLREGVYRKYPEASGNREHLIWNRIKYEYEIVCDSGFASYFLIVGDFVRWAKAQGILVGPGRGSAAGSTMAYVLDITSIDPIKYGLLFERFLNPERKSMPDIDIDFRDDRRDEVIQYVANKYGEEYVAHIATFSEFGPKSAINDVGRIKGIPLGETLGFSSLFSEDRITAKDLHTPLVQRAIQNNPELEAVFYEAMQLQGKKRQAGTHPSAIVISEEKLIDNVPLMKVKGKGDGLIQTQGNMYDVEAQGLLKMDFLGLTALTTIAMAVELIRETIPDFDIEKIPHNDMDVYEMLSRGEVFGVFQLGESAAARVTSVLKPQSVEEISIVSAMCRPGPVDNLATYLARKEGKEPYTLLHPDLEPIIGETYGFPIFQDQVMLMARVLAGYSLGEADSLRKAMGKKLPVEMAAQQERFVTGCVTKGIAKQDAIDLFEDLAKFSGYGFNKAHSTCYSVISYWTAWLSYHYPEIYLAAMMTKEFSDRKRVAMIIAEARRRKIPVLLPSVNSSQPFCTVEGNSIRLGLSLIKSIGYEVARRVSERAPYRTLNDFMERSGANIAGIHALIGVGACDDFEMDGWKARSIMYEYATVFTKSLQNHRQKSKSQQTRVANGGKIRKAVGDWSAPESPSEVKPWSQAKTLMEEMDAIGCYLSDSPILWLSQHDPRYNSLTSYVDIDAELVDEELPPFSFVFEIRDMSKVLTTKKDKKPFRRLVVGDAEGVTMDMVIFPREYESIANELHIGAFVAGYARMNSYQGQVSLIGSNVKVIDLTIVEKLQKDYDDNRLSDALNIIVPQKGDEEIRAEQYRTMVLNLLIDNNLLGEEPVVIYTDSFNSQLMHYGCSDLYAAQAILQEKVGPRVAVGPAPALWNNDCWTFYERKGDIPIPLADPIPVQINPQWRRTTHQEATGIITA